jgi:hypothetical protein
MPNAIAHSPHAKRDRFGIYCWFLKVLGFLGLLISQERITINPYYQCFSIHSHRLIWVKFGLSGVNNGTEEESGILLLDLDFCNRAIRHTQHFWDYVNPSF